MMSFNYDKDKTYILACSFGPDSMALFHMLLKEGYKFVNWNTKKDGTGTSYNAGSKYTTEASVTLYAQYEKELNEEETKYTITFYTNDGTTEKSTKVVNKGDKVVKPEDPTREGYTFDGWYDKKENGKE